MIRGTTPRIKLITDFDLSGWKLYLTFKCCTRVITVENDSLTVDRKDGKTTVIYVLTQEQTLSFNAGSICHIQLRAAKGAQAVASKVFDEPVDKILQGGVIDG